ncbi:iron-sulfur cluster assembly scaffold protein [Anaeromicrobium sediminis]|uniref:Iron-sulfur cluster assembly scaffold protein n=1 Tax=Anaeromicrobium sediminis TaxID=1478221 RepID=A0A267MD58_9FIRM|nr:iron-sulfur cluster assembly scaffold protein [Anaeromicrobium sediminis]PAB56740.1 iron-sulfur cluster assembly scaffold protein [Anaeromicrobium sediminis]
MYSQITMDHFQNPRNVGVIENYDGMGVAGDPECGDYLKIYIKVHNDFIKDIKFQVHGCCGAIASSSMTTVLAKDKPVMAAYAISEKNIIESLGGLPPEKEHCSVLGSLALKKAIVDYARNRKDK